MNTRPTVPRQRRKPATLSARATRNPTPPRIARALLHWFAREAEDLPWRRTADPYAVWVSEVMLQQTQVATVTPYYERWLRALPGVAALAAAPIDRVLKLWEGLGYYRRARDLHRSAVIIMNQHDGRFPREYEAVLALPGIGRYTAGAICSIAFNQPRPVLDGNVARVLARVYGIETPVRVVAGQRQLWAHAAALVEAARPPRPMSSRPAAPSGPGPQLTQTAPHGALNQALMELGRRVCAPRRPDCPHCPLRRLCAARATDRVATLPNLGPRPTPVSQRVIAVVIERRGRFLLCRRPDGGINARLWEFPNLTLNGTPTDDLPALLAETWPQLDPTALRPFMTVRHSITRHRITLEVWRGSTLPGPTPRPDDARWLTLTQAARRPFPAAHRRVLDRLLSATLSPPR